MKMDIQRLKENLEVQLSELESLQSMFCNPGEIRIEDVCTVLDMKHLVNGKSQMIPAQLDLAVNLVLDNLKFELDINLPQEYPQTLPDIIVRNNKLNRIQHAQLNKDLSTYMQTMERGEPCIFSAISWVQDHALAYADLEQVIENIEEKEEELVRYWIYSHHIYSKTKRREILNLAQMLNVHGFCMPGKPGIICVEGGIKNCNEWWQTVRSMTWKRIFCKVTEECNEDKTTFLKFSNFEEVAFQTSSIKCNHMDMGELHRYLEDHNCAYIFKDIFGVEAKSANTN